MRDLNDTQAKALGQNWTLVKTIEADLTKIQKKMEKDLETKDVSYQALKRREFNPNKLFDNQFCTITF